MIVGQDIYQSIQFNLFSLRLSVCDCKQDRSTVLCPLFFIEEIRKQIAVGLHTTLSHISCI